MAERKAPSKIKLTEKTVAKLALPENKSQAHFWDDKVAGFGVVVGKKKRSFVWKARVDGKSKLSSLPMATRCRMAILVRLALPVIELVAFGQ